MSVRLLEPSLNMSNFNVAECEVSGAGAASNRTFWTLSGRTSLGEFGMDGLGTERIGLMFPVTVDGRRTSRTLANAFRYAPLIKINTPAGTALRHAITSGLVEIRAAYTHRVEPSSPHPSRGFGIASHSDVGAMSTEASVQLIARSLFGLLMWWGNGKIRMPVEEVNTLFRRLAIPALKARALR